MLAKATEPVKSPIKRLVRGEDPASGCSVLIAVHANGVHSIIAEHQPAEPPKLECACAEDHTVTKLGHSRACPWFRSDQLTAVMPDLLTKPRSCPPTHADGSHHSFEWATYTDDTLTTGVCRCGVHQIDIDMSTLPW